MVWLVPFLTIKNRRKVVTHVSIYLWVCLLQAILALAIAQGGVAALDAMTGSKNGWSSDKILSVGAGACLFVYGLWLAWEWWVESQEEDDDDGDGDCDVDEVEGGEKDEESRKLMEGDTDYGSKKGSEVVVDEVAGKEGQQGDAGLSGFCEKLCGGTDGDDAKSIGQGKKGSKERSTNSLFIVAFLGSLDDLMLFIPMLVGKAVNWLELRKSLIAVRAYVCVVRESNTLCIMPSSKTCLEQCA